MPGTPRIPRPEGYVRTTHSGILGSQAWCQDCPWVLEAKNAMGSAARHADTYAHTVTVEQTVGVTYNRKSPEETVAALSQCSLTEPHEPHPRAIPVNGRLVQGECPGVAA